MPGLAIVIGSRALPRLMSEPSEGVAVDEVEGAEDPHADRQQINAGKAPKGSDTESD